MKNYPGGKELKQTYFVSSPDLIEVSKFHLKFVLFYNNIRITSEGGIELSVPKMAFGITRLAE